jgi:hypothetical protein
MIKMIKITIMMLMITPIMMRMINDDDVNVDTNDDDDQDNDKNKLFQFCLAALSSIIRVVALSSTQEFAQLPITSCLPPMT